jgi:hypothetical protein
MVLQKPSGRHDDDDDKDDSETTVMFSTLAKSLRWRRHRRLSSSLGALSIPFYCYSCLQAALLSTGGCDSFSMVIPPNGAASTKTAIPSSPPSSLRRTRVVREAGGGGGGGQKTTKKRKKITTTPVNGYDAGTLSTALFDDDFASSLESALFFRRRDPAPSSRELA